MGAVGRVDIGLEGTVGVFTKAAGDGAGLDQADVNAAAREFLAQGVGQASRANLEQT